MEAFEILIIILSVVLTIFLIIAIILSIVLIKLTRSIKRVADRAENVVGNVESAASAFRGAAGSLAAGKFLTNIFDLVSKSKKKGRK